MSKQNHNSEEDDISIEPKAKILKIESSSSNIDQSEDNFNINGSNVPPQSFTIDSEKVRPAINDCIFNKELRRNLHDLFLDKKDLCNDSVTLKLSSQPFPHCIIPDLITDSSFVRELELVLLKLPLTAKNNDLYKFHQSGELSNSSLPAIATFRLLCNYIKSFISEITEIPLNDKVDLFCSQYKYTDVLLCHDDELEGRRIAFIYYLVPELWQASDGGSLDLFNTDEFGQPKDVTKSIMPVRNNFLFFEVSEKSYHQVSEVLSKTKIRLSLTGWFHGPPLTRPAPHVEVVDPAVTFGNVDEDIFYSWFNPLYLDPEVQADIRSKFEEDSEIELTDFLQKKKYENLNSALKETNINWLLMGPPNKRHYYKADKASLPPIISEFLQVMHSDAAFLVMSSLTGLKLHPLAPTDELDTQSSSESSSTAGISDARCTSEVRRWEHSCYTLAHDTDPDMSEFALDTILYVGCQKEWNSECGGYTSYIAKAEDEELLSVLPSGNSLALVYRDKNTVKFVKHLNDNITQSSSTSSSSCFYELNSVYYE